MQIFLAIAMLAAASAAQASDVRQLALGALDPYVVGHVQYAVTDGGPLPSQLDVRPREMRTTLREAIGAQVARAKEAEAAPAAGAAAKEIAKGAAPSGPSAALSKGASVTVRFDLDRFVLKASERRRLLSAVKDFRSAKEIRISGYTCDLGSQAHNDILADARAKRVMQFLKAEGVVEPTLKVTGQGRCCYAAKDRPSNRRATVEAWVPSTEKIPLGGVAP